jgi:hypothetical protein
MGRLSLITITMGFALLFGTVVHRPATAVFTATASPCLWHANFA